MNVHFSSKTDNWATPQGFFDELNKEFNFTLDVCADEQNKKCDRFFGINSGIKGNGGLDWSWNHENIWMNPPYGREIGKWVKKASEARGG